MKSRFLTAAAALVLCLQAQAGSYVINSAGNIYIQQTANGGWKQLPGLAKAITCNSSGSLWIVGTDSSPYHWNGTGWDKVDGSAARIAVDLGGNPWVINDAGAIYQRVGGAWQKRPGQAKDIAIGGLGRWNHVCVIGTKAVAGGSAVYRWNGGDWQELVGHGATRVAVMADGNPLVIDDAGVPWYYRMDGSWSQVKPSPPGVAIAFGLGTGYLVGKDLVPGSTDHLLYRWDEPSRKWVQMDGHGVDIAVF